VCLVLSAARVSLPGAERANLAFQPASEPGLYRFDTGVLRGKVRAGGKSQGMIELVHTPSATAVPQGGDLPGLLSFYRVFSTGTRYGDAARDWPTANRILDDGALELRWRPASEHPLEITAVYRWTQADTLDLETTVRPEQAMPQFELFLSSYFRPGFHALVYVKPSLFSPGEPAFLPADVNPLVDGSYLMFPRDREAVLRIFDRRWEAPPNPVQWSITRWLGAPLAMRRDEASGVAALLMAPMEDCFAIATPYNKTPPDGVAGHFSLYCSLFGQNLAAGEVARAHTRLVVGKDLTGGRAVELYQQYLKELRTKP
jgi:hypothetical protein